MYHSFHRWITENANEAAQQTNRSYLGKRTLLSNMLNFQDILISLIEATAAIPGTYNMKVQAMCEYFEIVYVNSKENEY